jgi:hypothetical protein
VAQTKLTISKKKLNFLLREQGEDGEELPDNYIDPRLFN